jgi:phage repressor protein C with HTH and peptisase S24 domain
MIREYQSGMDKASENAIPVLAIPSGSRYRFGMNTLKRYRELKKLSQAELAELAGTSQPQITRLEKEKRKLSKQWAERLAPHVDATPQQLMFDTPKPRTKSKAASDKGSGARFIEMVEPETRAGAGGGGIYFEDLASTHNGIGLAADQIKDTWGLPASFVRGRLRISGGAAIVEIYGDSMYDPANPSAPGSLFPEDRVIVDLGDRRPSPPGPFLVWDGDGLVVKLVETVRGSSPARIRLKSRNPSYGPYEATEDEARIIGRVRGRISGM